MTPLWYMAPFYGMLRVIPHKLGGVMVMLSAMSVLFLVPWLDNSPVRSMRYKGRYSRIALGLMAVSFVALGYLGMHELTSVTQIMAQSATLLYFAYFLLMPFYTRWESTHTLSESTQ
jgi:ubiquinol-cytochrome c reductase cytochrome b subunit